MKTATLEKPTLISEELIAKLKGVLRGTVISPRDPSYDTERSVYNAMIDKRPGAIAKCKDVADVIATVNFARENNLLLSIRAGGHNAGGLGICNDGLVLDLSLMKGIRVDQKANTVRVEGGCLLGDLDHVTQQFGKAVPSGILSTTGIAGLALGGGIGHLSRAYGLTIDSILEVDVVLADGRLVTANAKQNADLFWAIRGGGGNFGVITSFLFKMHPGGTVVGGPMLWTIDKSEEIMKFYRDFILKAPNELYCYFAFVTVPPVAMFPAEFHLKKMCGLIWCNVGSQAKATKAVQKFRDFRKPAIDFTGPLPVAGLQSLFDALYPKGLQWYWKADFVKDLTDEAIQINVKYGNMLPSPQSTMHMYPINGAAQKKKNSDTAFGYRHANWAQVMVGVDPDPAKREQISKWAKDYWAALHPFSAGGAYLNFMMEEGADRVKAAYGANHNRLVKIKRKYDPKNLFSVNQNIKPG